MARISVTINTCNEAHHLRACVESVRPLADEIVVCDTKLADGSCERLELSCHQLPTGPRRGRP